MLRGVGLSKPSGVRQAEWEALCSASRATPPIRTYRAHSQFFMHMEQGVQGCSKPEPHSHVALECITHAAAQGHRAERKHPDCMSSSPADNSTPSPGGASVWKLGGDRWVKIGSLFICISTLHKIQTDSQHL